MAKSETGGGADAPSISMKTKTYRIDDLCRTVKGNSATLKTQPGPYPLVVTAEYRRSADTWQLEGPAVCIPLVSSTGHGDAALHRVHYQEGKFALANLLVALLPKDPEICNGKYLYHFLMTRKDQLLVPLMQGTANVSLKEQDIAGVEIPLPPLAEQQRIVARIEELAGKIEEAKRLRQEAVEEGKGMGAVVRNSIYTDKMMGCDRVRLESVATRITKGESPEWQGFSYQDFGPLFVRSENVLWGSLDLNGAMHIPEEFHMKLRRSQLREGDVLVNLVGASIGRPSAVPSGIGVANINQAVGVISPQPARLLADYLVHFILSSGTQEVIHGGKVETARPNISLQDLRNLSLPLPSLSEQRRIVAELDAIQAKVDSLMAFQAETALELDALLPALLDRAFKGEI